MKYTSPNSGNYESGLTARQLYDSIDFLVREHVIRKGITKFEVDRLKREGIGIGKIWDRPEIRTELEEFVRSYYFQNLGEPLPGFAEIFNERDIAQRHLRLVRYIGQLAQEYGPNFDSVGTVSSLLEELKKRGGHFFNELMKVNGIDGLDLTKRLTRDAFSQLLPIHSRIELAIDHISHQS